MDPWWSGVPGFEPAGAEDRPSGVLERWQARLAELEEERERLAKKVWTPRQMYEVWLYELRRVSEDAVVTGWPGIDLALKRPILPGEVVLIGARPGVGKTFLAQHLVELALREEYHRVLFCSIEMSLYQIGERFAAHALGVSPDEAFRRGREGGVTVDDLEAGTIGADRLVIYDRALALDAVADVVKSAATRMDAPPTIVVIDYLGLLEGRGKGSRYEQVSDQARQLKTLAKEHDIVLIVNAQLSRAAGDGNVEPTLAAFRDSGATEEAGDRVLMAWLASDDGRQIMLKVAKNRYGPLGRVRLAYTESMGLREVLDDELYAVRDAR